MVIGVLLVFVGAEVNLAPEVDMKIGDILERIRCLGTESNGNKGLLEQKKKIELEQEMKAVRAHFDHLRALDEVVNEFKKI
jgi:hypothetical protein